MTALKMPGFTAPASLYRSGGHFRKAEARNTLAGNGGVLPQLPIGFCQANCDSIEDDFMRSVCELQCREDQGSGGGGGGNPVCKPRCGPCLSDESSPTGGYRTCVYANCDEYDRQCYRPKTHTRPGKLGTWT